MLCTVLAGDGALHAESGAQDEQGGGARHGVDRRSGDASFRNARRAARGQGLSHGGPCDRARDAHRRRAHETFDEGRQGARGGDAVGRGAGGRGDCGGDFLRRLSRHGHRELHVVPGCDDVVLSVDPHRSRISTPPCQRRIGGGGARLCAARCAERDRGRRRARRVEACAGAAAREHCVQRGLVRISASAIAALDDVDVRGAGGQDRGAGRAVGRRQEHDARI